MRKFINAIAGLVIPIRITSRLYLTDRLAQYGVDVKNLPEACLQELADDIVITTKNIAALSRKGWREIVTFHLDGAAVNIANILNGTFRGDTTTDRYAENFREILTRHGVSPPIKS